MALYTDTVMDHFMNPRNVGEIPDADGIGLAAMPCESAVQAFKSAVAGHKDLTGQNFLCRAAIKYDSAGQLLLFHFSLHADSGAQAGDIKQVVAAALAGSADFHGILDRADLLAHAGQSIQLTQKADNGMAAAPLANNTGRQICITGPG